MGGTPTLMAVGAEGYSAVLRDFFRFAFGRGEEIRGGGVEERACEMIGPGEEVIGFVGGGNPF